MRSSLTWAPHYCILGTLQIRLLQLTCPLCELVCTPAFLDLLIAACCHLLGAMLLVVRFTLLNIFLSDGSLFFELALFTCVCLATLSTHLAVLLTGDNNLLITQLNDNFRFFFAVFTVLTGLGKEVIDGTRDASDHLVCIHLSFHGHCFLVHFLVLIHDFSFHACETLHTMFVLLVWLFERIYYIVFYITCQHFNLNTIN
mgnify:FL=1